MREFADIFINPIVGAEAVTGSSRMKAGTAQKMILNILSTGAMVKFGRTRGNLMAFMVPSNIKLVDRAVRMVCESTGADRELAEKMLEKYDGIVVPGGFGSRGIEGKILTAKYAREHKVPYFL